MEEPVFEARIQMALFKSLQRFFFHLSDSRLGFSNHHLFGPWFLVMSWSHETSWDQVPSHLCVAYFLLRACLLHVLLASFSHSSWNDFIQLSPFVLGLRMSPWDDLDDLDDLDDWCLQAETSVSTVSACAQPDLSGWSRHHLRDTRHAWNVPMKLPTCI